MATFTTAISLYLVVLLALLVPPNKAGVNYDRRRLATALRQEQRLQDRWMDSNPEVIDDYSDYLKRSDIGSIVNPSDLVLNNPAALRDYLRQINEYFAIIGRPRSVSFSLSIQYFHEVLNPYFDYL